LQQFEPITLEEMEGVKLMNRTDTKFVFTLNSFEKALSEIVNHYRVLEVNGKRLSKYKTLYYDTAGLNLYGAHHNGKLNRYKVRHRTYVESDLGFLEVKFKNNKGRTLKKRVNAPNPPVIWEGENAVFLNKTQPFNPDTLVPVMWVNYSRCTLVSKTDPERLTIDLDLEFVKDDITKEMKGMVIAEVKQEKRKSSAFLGIMKKYHIREGSISKYCLGIAIMCNHVKKNNFKRKLINIKHILDYDATTNS
jgi:hypothetical protein